MKKYKYTKEVVEKGLKKVLEDEYLCEKIDTLCIMWQNEFGLKPEEAVAQVIYDAVDKLYWSDEAAEKPGDEDEEDEEWQ